MLRLNQRDAVVLARQAEAERGAARYEDIMFCMVLGVRICVAFLVIGLRGRFVGAALPRWRWLALSLASRGSAARYEGITLCAVLGVGGCAVRDG